MKLKFVIAGAAALALAACGEGERRGAGYYELQFHGVSPASGGRAWPTKRGAAGSRETGY